MNGDIHLYQYVSCFIHIFHYLEIWEDVRLNYSDVIKLFQTRSCREHL